MGDIKMRRRIAGLLGGANPQMQQVLSMFGRGAPQPWQGPGGQGPGITTAYQPPGATRLQQPQMPQAPGITTAYQPPGARRFQSAQSGGLAGPMFGGMPPGGRRF